MKNGLQTLKMLKVNFNSNKLDKNNISLKNRKRTFPESEFLRLDNPKKSPLRSSLVVY